MQNDLTQYAMVLAGDRPVIAAFSFTTPGDFIDELGAHFALLRDGIGNNLRGLRGHVAGICVCLVNWKRGF